MPIAANTTQIPAGTADPIIIRNIRGVYYGLIVTSSAAGVPVVYDNATASSGKVVGEAPASTIGQSLGPANGITCNNGITVSGGSTMPSMTILWS